MPGYRVISFTLLRIQLPAIDNTPDSLNRVQITAVACTSGVVDERKRRIGRSLPLLPLVIK